MLRLSLFLSLFYNYNIISKYCGKEIRVSLMKKCKKAFKPVKVRVTLPLLQKFPLKGLQMVAASSAWLCNLIKLPLTPPSNVATPLKGPGVESRPGPITSSGNMAT